MAALTVIELTKHFCISVADIVISSLVIFLLSIVHNLQLSATEFSVIDINYIFCNDSVVTVYSTWYKLANVTSQCFTTD